MFLSFKKSDFGFKFKFNFKLGVKVKFEILKLKLKLNPKSGKMSVKIISPKVFQDVEEVL